MKIIRNVLLSLVFLYVILYTVANLDRIFPGFYTAFSSKFTKEKFSQIHNGVHIKDVNKLLGKPLSVGIIPYVIDEDSIPKNSRYEFSYSMENHEKALFPFFQWEYYSVFTDKDSIVVTKRHITIYE